MPAPAIAQQPDTAAADTTHADTVYAVPEIAVRVARPMAESGGAGAVTVPLDSMDAPPSPTLEDVLRRLPFIQIRENSRGEAQPSLRGVEARQIAVLVDGIPLTLGWDDRADLSVVPLNAARQVTLTRGLSSVLDGPNALGGAVKVGIAHGPDLPIDPDPLRLSAGVDHTGASGLALDLGTALDAPGGRLGLRAGGGFRDRSEVPAPAFGPGPARSRAAVSGDRPNSDLEHLNGFAVARYRSDRGRWLSLSTFAFRAEKGVPPELHVEEPRLWRVPETWRWVTSLSAGTGWGRTRLGEGDLEAAFGLDLGRTEIDEYDSLAYENVVGGEIGEDRTSSLRLLGDHTVGPGILHAALTLAETRHIEELPEPDGRSRYRQRLWSLGLELEQPLFGTVGGGPGGADAGGAAAREAARGRVSVGFSVDGADTPETGGRPPRDRLWDWGARAGGTWVLAADVLLHGGVSRRVRFPALRELYSGALGRFVPNPDLSPEALWVAELGATYSRGRVDGQAVAFHQRLRDAIAREAADDGRFRRVNRDEVRSTGLELLARYRWRRLALTADVTLQDVELADPSAAAGERRPEYQPWLAGTVEAGLRIPRAGRASVTVHHLGRQHCVHPDLGGTVALDASSWVDVSFDRELPAAGLGRRLQLTAAVENVTDAAVFDQCGLPRPGRLLRVQVRVF